MRPRSDVRRGDAPAVDGVGPAAVTGPADAVGRGAAAVPGASGARAARLATAVALAASVGLAALLAGCSEGYPGEDRPIVSPFDMNNTERVAELNVVAQESRGGDGSGRWSYTLHDDCRLEVRQRGKSSGPPAAAVTRLTRTMDAQVVFDAETRTYDVVLVDRRVEPPVHVGTLLKSGDWTHATQAGLLMDLIIRDCARASRALDRAPGPPTRPRSG
ncbi:hypothetical protein CDN99_26515 [Roseateles aquatilis]|uniref:Uncharacterized protein n=1 Tax=Roseateles aquatilis TaxID=431061 RepID=A0A246IT55_9BURK|nr:hypothetical protein [Roseateles aquatilis]OWQ83402.1 hypothetical protein CDN99_26515 [Roseateles aquatilis]